MITDLSSKVKYVIKYDENNEFELPFFNVSYWNDKLDEVNIKIKINLIMKDVKEEYNYKTAPLQIKYINNDTFLLYMNSNNSINIKLEEMKLYYNKKERNYDFIKLKTVVGHRNIENIIISIITESKTYYENKIKTLKEFDKTKKNINEEHNELF